MEKIQTVADKWRGESNNVNCNPVLVVLKKGKTSKYCYNLGPTCTKRAQCINGPHAKRKTSFCVETINKSRS